MSMDDIDISLGETLSRSLEDGLNKEFAPDTSSLTRTSRRGVLFGLFALAGSAFAVGKSLTNDSAVKDQSRLVSGADGEAVEILETQPPAANMDPEKAYDIWHMKRYPAPPTQELEIAIEIDDEPEPLAKKEELPSLEKIEQPLDEKKKEQQPPLTTKKKVEESPATKKKKEVEPIAPKKAEEKPVFKKKESRTAEKEKPEPSKKDAPAKQMQPAPVRQERVGNGVVLYSRHTGERFNFNFAEKNTGKCKNAFNYWARDHRNGQKIAMDPRLLDRIEKIVSHLRSRGERVTQVDLISGYRSRQSNEKLRKDPRRGGQAQNSYHITGKALDIAVNGLSTAKLYAACDAVVGGSGGVGRYDSSDFVHIDVRGSKARWDGAGRKKNQKRKTPIMALNR